MNSYDKYLGQTLDERYEILERIGEGGMALVYKALDHRLNRYVAVKIMRDEMAEDDDLRRRFTTEAHAVAMLSNPNIVAVYDVSHSDVLEYIVMEYVDGVTLKYYMERKGAISWREVLHFSRQIARALAHAHERGIIHRDIKPKNIMLLRDGTVKVADFGIAALENEYHESNGEAVGSVHYIAPEQARGENPDARSDLYSLGVVMYEMLTGRKPFNGDSVGEIAMKHMNMTPMPPHSIIPGIPDDLEAITLRAMNPNIEDRYQSARELLADLDWFSQNQVRAEEKSEMENPAVVPIRSGTELSKEQYSRRRRRSGRVSFLTGVFGAILAILALVIFLWKFWLGDIFAPAERIHLPEFVNKNYESLIQNPEYAKLYHFEVVYVYDQTKEAGIVLSQSPNAGRSMMITPSGINVQLVVSSGDSLVQIPNVINMDYRTASAVMRQAGLYVEIVNSVSDTVARDNVIATEPAIGLEVSRGSIVYMTVSVGPKVLTISMPNLIGLSENAAIVQIESNRLSYGGSEYVVSDLPAGTVIFQNIEAFTAIDEHTKVILRVSTGPESP